MGHRTAKYIEAIILFFSSVANLLLFSAQLQSQTSFRIHECISDNKYLSPRWEHKLIKVFGYLILSALATIGN